MLLHGEAAQGRLTRDVTVGPNHDVQLKVGQTVQILNQSGAQMVVSVQLPDGSSGIYQIDAAAIELAASPSPSPSPTPSPTPVPAPSPATPPPVAPPSAQSIAPPAPPAAANLHTNSTPSAALPAPEAPSSVPDPNLPEDKVSLVNVTLAEDTKLPPPYAGEDIAKAGAYSYHLYLPPGYYAQADARFPALFIMSPNGNATLSKFAPRARDEGWIVVMLVEAKNGPWGPIYGDMLATYADVKAKGLRIQEGLQFATGFSGGARGTSMMSQFEPGFDGELLQGAGFAFGESGFHLAGVPHDHPYAIFMTMGTRDSNFTEIAKMKDAVHGVPFKVATFDGGHQGAPVGKFNEGLDWLIEQAFTGDAISSGLRQCGVRQFKFLASRWSAEPDAAVKSDQAAALIAFGDKLNLPASSTDGAELAGIKNAAR
jgi:hypothetical protein